MPTHFLVVFPAHPPPTRASHPGLFDILESSPRHLKLSATTYCMEVEETSAGLLKNLMGHLRMDDDVVVCRLAERGTLWAVGTVDLNVRLKVAFS